MYSASAARLCVAWMTTQSRFSTNVARYANFFLLALASVAKNAQRGACEASRSASECLGRTTPP